MKNVKTLKIVALIFPGAVMAILLLFALGETFGGDWSGLGHLVQAIPIVLGMWVGWKRPLWGVPSRSEPARSLFLCRRLRRTGLADSLCNHRRALIPFRHLIAGRSRLGEENDTKINRRARCAPDSPGQYFFTRKYGAWLSAR